MELIDSFNRRTEEVNIFISFVLKTDKIETYKQKKNALECIVSRDLQKILRANCFLLLYNLIEATVKDGIWKIYDTVEDNNLGYNDISEKLKEVWLEEKRKEFSELSSSGKVKDRIKVFIENTSLEHIITFSKDRISISGNLDYRSINDIINQYGFFGHLKVKDEKLLKKALLKVKSERNALAHGNKSFRQTAEIITIQQIVEYKELIIDFLKQFSINITKYIESEGYKKLPPTLAKKS